MTMKRTISGMIGTGSLAHNRRDFIAENVDPDRVQLNICYQNENLKEVYKELFDDAVERWLHPNADMATPFLLQGVAIFLYRYWSVGGYRVSMKLFCCSRKVILWDSPLSEISVECLFNDCIQSFCMPQIRGL